MVPLSFPAPPLRQTVHEEVEECADNDEPERKHLGGKPEVKRQVEKSEPFEPAASVRPCREHEPELETENGNPPADKDGNHGQNLAPHDSRLRTKEIYFKLSVEAVHFRSSFCHFLILSYPNKLTPYHP